MLFALTTESAKSTALIGLLAVVVIGVVGALVVKAVVTKLITVAVAAVFAFGFASQRSSIQDCAKKVKDNALVVGASAKTECTFFGIKVNVPTDKINKP
jgi:proteasome assembly chaperone (PAC2) family protein